MKSSCVTFLERIKGNRKPPFPPIKAEAMQRPKLRSHPLFFRGGSIYFSSDCVIEENLCSALVIAHKTDMIIREGVKT